MPAWACAARPSLRPIRFEQNGSNGHSSRTQRAVPAAEGFRHHRRRRERGRDRRRAINNVTSRIHRGFHRIGIVLAVLVLLLDVVAVFVIHADSALPLIVVAAFLYVAARAVGWILAGFLGSSGQS